MTDLPAELRGNHPLANWSKKLIRAIRRRTPLEGLGYKLRQTEQGFTHEIIPGGGGGGHLEMYRLKSVQADYVTARTWNGETEGSTDIFIAKNTETRQPASETIAGELWTYTYGTGADANNQYRSAAHGTVTESQVVTPYWIADDTPSAIIFAMSAGNTGIIKDEGLATEQTLTKLLITARCWAKRA